MERISIPDIRQIFQGSYNTIDTFATWCEDIEVMILIHSNFTGFPIETVKKVMQRLTDYKPNTVFPEINKLFYLLAETLLEAVNEVSDKGHANNSFVQKIRKMTLKHSRNLPIPLVDKENIHRYEKDVQVLKNLVKQHEQIYKDIQRQQEVCWIANSKMTTYELYVSTAKSSRSQLSNQLPKKEQQEQDTALQQLQRMLNEKKELATEASQKYNRLLETENAIRSTIMQLERKITGDIMYQMTERLTSGLSALRQILTTKSNKRTNILLSHIKEVEFNMTSLASSIIDTLSSKYKCCNPKDFQQQNGYSVRLPDCSFIKNKERIEKLKTSTKKTEQKNNNNNTGECNVFACGNFQRQKYIKPESLHEANANSMCFTRLSKGMIVKQKISTESTDVFFGWVKQKAWCNKKWGFFSRNIGSA